MHYNELVVYEMAGSIRFTVNTWYAALGRGLLCHGELTVSPLAYVIKKTSNVKTN